MYSRICKNRRRGKHGSRWAPGTSGRGSVGCGQDFGFYPMCKGKVLKDFKQGSGMARSVFFRKCGEAAGVKRALVGRGRDSDYSRGGGGEGEEKPGFYDGLEPRKGHRYNLFLMRNIINIRDQRGNNRTQPASLEKRKFRNDRAAQISEVVVLQ